MLTYDKSDIDLYDAYCHKQDRSYTISHLYNFVRKAGLEIIRFSNRRDLARLALKHLDLGQEIRKLLNKFDAEYKKSIAELIDGTLYNHDVYIAKKFDTEASPNDEDIVPYIYGNPLGLMEVLRQGENKNGGWMIDAKYWDTLVPSSGVFSISFQMQKL